MKSAAQCTCVYWMIWAANYRTKSTFINYLLQKTRRWFHCLFCEILHFVINFVPFKRMLCHQPFICTVVINRIMIVAISQRWLTKWYRLYLDPFSSPFIVIPKSFCEHLMNRTIWKLTSFLYSTRKAIENLLFFWTSCFISQSFIHSESYKLNPHPIFIFYPGKKEVKKTTPTGPLHKDCSFYFIVYFPCIFLPIKHFRIMYLRTTQHIQATGTNSFFTY